MYLSNMSIQTFMKQTFQHCNRSEILFGEVFNEYNKWCSENNERPLYSVKNMFSKILYENLGYRYITYDKLKYVKNIDYINRGNKEIEDAPLEVRIDHWVPPIKETLKPVIVFPKKKIVKKKKIQEEKAEVKAEIRNENVEINNKISDINTMK
jgi:hypothetical protein